MNNISVISGRRILFLAIAVSLVWHIVCISSVKIITASSSAPVKFSKVSFLGPFLERGPINLRVQPKEMAFLEKRYQARLQDLTNDVTYQGDTFLERHRESRKADIISDKRAVKFIDEVLSTPKQEPVYVAE